MVRRRLAGIGSEELQVSLTGAHRHWATLVSCLTRPSGRGPGVLAPGRIRPQRFGRIPRRRRGGTQPVVKSCRLQISPVGRSRSSQEPTDAGLFWVE